MMQGAVPDLLQTTSVALTSLVQQSLPPGSAEQPTPPHWPQLTGQQTSADSYPARPLEHVPTAAGRY